MARAMKDSGIEWIGEIPEEWEIHRVSNYFSERRNRNYAMQEQNLLSLSYGKIIQKDINTVGGLLPASFNTYNIVEANDIIIRPTDLQNDWRSLRTGLVTQRGIITAAYIALKPKPGVYSAYFHYLLHSYFPPKAGLRRAPECFDSLGNTQTRTSTAKTNGAASGQQNDFTVSDIIYRNCSENSKKQR